MSVETIDPDLMTCEEQRKKTNVLGGERRAEDAQRIEDALGSRGQVFLRVYGTSMLPWVRPGDIALIRQISVENVQCGEVVLFRRENRFFVHRIVEKRASPGLPQLLSKGDAHPTSDGSLDNRELCGRVVRIYRAGRRIDLDAPGRRALGVFISQLSLYSRFWYPLAKIAALVTRPMRRALNALLISGAIFL